MKERVGNNMDFGGTAGKRRVRRTQQNFSKKNLVGFILPNFLKRNLGGFTLIELLVVIGILAALSAVIVITLNPAEIFKQGRDTVRISDLGMLSKALAIHKVDGSGFTGDPTMVYVSLPDENGTPGTRTVGNQTSCGSISPLPTLPPTYTYNCVHPDDFLKIDGTGWIPVDFTTVASGAPLSNLPRDPVNDAARMLYYTYVSGSFEVTALFESNKLNSATINDGGESVGVYEIGTNVKLTPETRDTGLVGYWKLDDGAGGAGTSATNSSGKGSNGTLSGGPVWTTGKIGGGLFFNYATLDRVTVGSYSDINPASDVTAMAWVKPEPGYGSVATPVDIGPGIMGKEGTIFAWGALGVGTEGILWGRIYQNSDTPVNVFGDPVLGFVPIVPEWSHVAMVADSRASPTPQVRLYLNGVQVGNGEYDGTLKNNTSGLFFIGRHGPNISPEYFKGTIDEVRVYNRALSGSEIQAYYGATR